MTIDFTKTKARSTPNMTRWSFIAKSKKPIGHTRKRVFRGLIVENKGLNMTSIYRGRTSKTGLIFSSSPSPGGYNTQAGIAIYEAFQKN